MQPVIARRINRWLDGTPSPPWELMLCPTHRCNLNCGICSRVWEEEINPLLLKELPDERWLTLVEEAAALGVRFLSIGGGGEPTVRRKLVLDICVKAKEMEMEGLLQTNGTLLQEEDLQQLIDIGWDNITISLDGPTEAINDAIRYPGAYTKTIATIQKLVALKKSHKTSLPKLHINTVVTALNWEHLSDMVSLCHELGCNVFSAVELIEYSPDMTSYMLSEEQKEKSTDAIAKAIQLADRLQLSNNLDGLLQKRAASTVSHESTDACSCCSESSCTPYCLEPWRGAVVTAGGQVMPCCFFWEGGAENIRDKSLRDVWYGDYLSRFREAMRSGDISPFCRQCGFPQSAAHKKLQQCVLNDKEAVSGFRNLLNQISGLGGRVRQYGIKGMLRRLKEKQKIEAALKKEDL